jgi:hypothetical protein
LQRGCSRRRPHHGLHDQEQRPAHAGLPGLFQTVCARARGQGGNASQHQAGNFAKTVNAKDLLILV